MNKFHAYLLLSFLFVLLGLNQKVSAQGIPGFNLGNYGGINSLDIQPASIVDSRYSSDFILGGFGLTFNTNICGLDGDALRDKSMFNFDENGYKLRDKRLSPFQDKFMKSYINQSSKENYKVYLGSYISLPSAMAEVTDRLAIGFTNRIRFGFNIDNLTPDLASIMYYANNDPDFYKRKLTNDSAAINSMLWMEFGIAGGYVLLKEDRHFIKAGGRIKFNPGIDAGYMYANDLTYRFENKDSLTLIASEFSYGHSDNYEFNPDNIKLNRFSTKPAMGFDIGVVYEHRPEYPNKFKYDMDGRNGLERKDLNKYNWRIGASIMDIGRIKFNKSPQSRNFSANINNWNINNIELGRENTPVKALDDTLARRFKLNAQDNTFYMGLPTAFSIQVDYNIFGDFYINFNNYNHFWFKEDKHKLRTMDYYMLTPRWENRWFGVYAPQTINEYGKYQIGLTLRLGFLVIGSNDLSALLNTWVSGGDLHATIKMPIFQKKPPKDKDKDGVSDKMDICPEISGVYAFKGCPDKDNDGIQDSEDNCPEEYGLKENKGCPDKDEDGIIDKLDSCVNEKGLAEFNGCPDTDGDGVIDKLDSCKEVKGLASLNGCPDTDGDGITDAKDKCPDVAGPMETNGCPDRDKDGVLDNDDACPDVAGSPKHKGCPDTDGDGIYDNLDKCPNEFGEADNQGCPYGDRDNDGVKDNVDKCPDVAGPEDNSGCPPNDADGDGIPDKLDKCPLTPGPASNKGCPIITEEIKQVIDSAVRNLEFETGKDIILESSYASLDELGYILIKNPTMKLRIAGHTDNVGKKQANMELSKKRATAVKNYLIKIGVNPANFKVEWFGDSKPIAPNTNPQGRARNRRVEMKPNFK